MHYRAPPPLLRAVTSLLRVTGQVDWFSPFWPDEYAFRSNFVKEPLSRFQLESLPNSETVIGLWKLKAWVLPPMRRLLKRSTVGRAKWMDLP